MVVRLALVLAAWFGLALPLKALCAEPVFRLRLASPVVEYGKFVTADLSARDSLPDLSTLSLSALARDFVVATPDTVVRDDEDHRQHWPIRLYPRRPGALWIPPLYFHGYKTKPSKLSVKPAVGGRLKTPIEVSSVVGDTKVWTKQAVRVSMQFESLSRYARIEAETEKQDGLDIETLPISRTHRSLNGQHYTVQRIGWLLYPQTSGIHTIQLPAVSYRLDGVVTHRFYPPAITLHVRPLPAFVPPTIPVGRMQLDVELPERFYLLEHEIGFLRLRIRSEGPPAVRPSTLLGQLRSNRTVSFYSPRRVDTELADVVDGQNTEAYQVPFVAKSLGLIRLPTLRLQFFDPATGKIVTQMKALGMFVAISGWMRYVALVGLLFILYAAANRLYRWAKQKYCLYRGYRLALVQIQQATTPQELKAALNDISRAENWSHNLTLLAWLEHWSAHYPCLSYLSASVLSLQGWLYGAETAALEDVRSSLIELCYRRMPLLKIVF